MEFRKANALPDQPATPGTKEKMVALNALCIAFSGYDNTFGNMFLKCVFAICIDRININRIEKGKSLNIARK